MDVPSINQTVGRRPRILTGKLGFQPNCLANSFQWSTGRLPAQGWSSFERQGNDRHAWIQRAQNLEVMERHLILLRVCKENGQVVHGRAESRRREKALA